MGHDVGLVDAAPTPTAVVVATTTWQEYPTLWGTLLDEVWAVIRAGDATKDGHNVMLYLDDTPHVEVGVQVRGPFSPSGRVVQSTLPAGPATTVHRGPYDRLGEAHHAVHRWAAANGHQLSRVRWEVYGDWVDDPDALETAVTWRLL